MSTSRRIDVPDHATALATVADLQAKGWELVEATVTVWTLRLRAATGKRSRVQVVAAAPPLTFSEDGDWWWDETAGMWKGCDVEVPPGTTRSPDGVWWWDGGRWRPVPAVDVGDAFL
jgi:hypothetical protein